MGRFQSNMFQRVNIRADNEPSVNPNDPGYAEGSNGFNFGKPGKFYGTGAEIYKKDEEPVTISRVFKNSPAEKAGLKPGDQYIKVIIKMPTSLSKDQKELLEKYKEKSKDTDNIFKNFKKIFKK